jgi:hypothetical protein
MPWQPDLSPTQIDGNPNQKYNYHWKQFACADVVQECYRLGTLGDSPATEQTCFQVADRLTRGLTDSLVGDTVSYSAGINLDFILEAHLRLADRVPRPRIQACEVAMLR